MCCPASPAGEGRVYRTAGLRALALASRGDGDRGAGRGSPGTLEVCYTEAMPPRGRGPLPQRGEEAPQRDRRAARPLRVRAGACGGVLAADGEPGAADARVVGRPRLPAPDRPRPPGRLGAEDDQPPLLERRSTTRSACCARPSPRARPSDGENVDDNRPQPRDRAGRRPRDDRGRFRIAGEAPPRGRDPQLHPELDQGGQVHLPQERARAARTRRSRSWPTRSSASATAGVDGGDLSAGHADGPARGARAGGSSPTSSTSSTSPRTYLNVGDFHELCQTIVYPPRSHGTLGGKGAGLLPRLLDRVAIPEYQDDARRSRCRAPGTSPRTPSSTSSITTTSRTSTTRSTPTSTRSGATTPTSSSSSRTRPSPPDILRGLSDVLDDLDERPIIVRSSSLLEDRLGTAFSGKYKSLFLANPGTKRERLAALHDAIAEIYASVFGPDPIEYRRDRGLLDFARADGHPRSRRWSARASGRTTCRPSPASPSADNEFRWSPRIKREDGLLRIVPGLGTRAVDRLADDYPRPGRPRPAGPAREPDARRDRCATRRRRSTSSTSRPAPSRPSTSRSCWSEHGDELPLLRQMISIADLDHLRRPVGLVDVDEGRPSSPSRASSRTRRSCPHADPPAGAAGEAPEPGGHRVRLGRRGTSTSSSAGPRAPPRAPPPSPSPATCRTTGVLFTARRYVSNGQVSDISHVVYVDPGEYARLRARPDPRGRARGRPPQPAAAEAAVRPDGAGPLGLARGHPARRARHLRGHQQHGDAHRGGPAEGRLPARPLVRHPLLPGPGRVARSATCRSTPTTPRSSSTRPSSCARRTRSRASPPSSRRSPTSCA